MGLKYHVVSLTLLADYHIKKSNLNMNLASENYFDIYLNIGS